MSHNHRKALMTDIWRKQIAVSILYKSIAGRYRPVSYPDGPITARYRFILTPLLVLFFICLYISSRALSKAFEHRNFVARYQRETSHITVEKVPCLVTMDASLQYWSKQSYT